MMAQKHLSVFHAGVIGYGLRGDARGDTQVQADTDCNTRLLVSAVTACCQSDVTNLALLLVEVLSPDVMYNGLPWPDEDFCKVGNVV